MRLKSWTTFNISRGNQRLRAEICSVTEIRHFEGQNCLKFWFWHWYKLPKTDYSSVAQARRCIQRSILILIFIPCFGIGCILLRFTLFGSQVARQRVDRLLLSGHLGRPVWEPDRGLSPLISPPPHIQPFVFKEGSFSLTRQWCEVQLHLSVGRCPIGIQQPLC